MCFILDASTWGWGGVVDVCPKAVPATEEQGLRALWTSSGGGQGREGLHVDTAQSALTVALRLVLSGLRSVTPFLAQSLFSSWVSLVPFLRGPFSEPRQLVAWAQAGPPVVNSSPWVSVSVRLLTGCGSESYLWP